MPACNALAEVLVDLGLTNEAALVRADDRSDGAAATILAGLMSLHGRAVSETRAVLRICLPAWQCGTADKDRRVAACLTELGAVGCTACALGALSDDGPCDVHGDGEGGAR